MAHRLTEPDELIASIIEGSLNVSGMTAQAQALAIPSGRFLPTPNRAPLRGAWAKDAGAVWHRAYTRNWRAASDPLPRNPLNGNRLARYTLVVEVGILTGAPAVHLTGTAGNETQAEVAFDGETLATAEGDRIAEALSLGELYQGSTDPPIVRIARNGETRTEQYSDTQLIATTNYDVDLWVSNTEPVDP